MSKQQRSAFTRTHPNPVALLFLLLLFLLPGGSLQPASKDPPVTIGLAPTPPMGFDQYNTFHDHITSADLKQMADVMVASGMRDAGYTLLATDDSWAGYSRTPDGTMMIDTTQFPNVNGVNGIEDLARYVHARGLKLGIYTTDGPRTCVGNRLGSYGYEATDVKSYISWGVDFLKIDGCSVWPNDQAVINSAKTFHDLAVADGHPLLLSIHTPTDFQASDLPALFKYAQMVRTLPDIADSFASALGQAVAQDPLARYAGPDRWNDPDMLEVGMPGMSETESQTHFSLWCIAAAPLLAGNDLRAMTPATLAILTNREAIAIDQDPAGIQGQLISIVGDTQVWSRPLANGDYAVLLLNAGDAPTLIRTTARVIGDSAAPAYDVRNVWTHTTSTTSGLISDWAPPYGSVLLRISKPSQTSTPLPLLPAALLCLPLCWSLPRRQALPVLA